MASSLQSGASVIDEWQSEHNCLTSAKPPFPEREYSALPPVLAIPIMITPGFQVRCLLIIFCLSLSLLAEGQPPASRPSDGSITVTATAAGEWRDQVFDRSEKDSITQVGRGATTVDIRLAGLQLARVIKWRIVRVDEAMDDAGTSLLPQSNKAATENRADDDYEKVEREEGAPRDSVDAHIRLSLSSRKATKIVRLRAQLGLVSDAGEITVPVDLHDIPLP